MEYIIVCGLVFDYSLCLLNSLVNSVLLLVFVGRLSSVRVVGLVIIRCGLVMGLGRILVEKVLFRWVKWLLKLRLLSDFKRGFW